MRAPARRGRRYSALTAPLLVAAAAAISVACDSIPTNPQQVFSLTVDSAPSPSVVAGDTLRDTNGIVAPLKGQAFNVADDSLTTVPVRFISLSPNQLTINSVNIAIGAKTGDSVARVVASAQSLQSLPFTLPVVLRPDSIVYSDSDSVTTIKLSQSNLDSNTSPGLDILLKHIPDTNGADALTRTYLVHWRIMYPAGATKGTGAPGDTLLPAYLSDPSGNPSRTDTTDANGSGTRLIKINVFKVSPTAKDSVVAVASAFYRTTPVANSPLRFVVHYLGPLATSSAVVRGSAVSSCVRGPCHDRH